MSKPPADSPVSRLVAVPGFAFAVQASPGVVESARPIAERCARALRFFGDLFDFSPTLTVRVLAPEDWADCALFPVYGMPHCVDSETLAVAGEDNDFWQGFAPPDDALSAEMRARVQAVYGGRDGVLDLSPFFDLLAIHEMGHVFHLQAGRRFARRWLMELFCNVALHAYVAAVEPERLAALETFPQMVAGMGHARYAHHTLDDFERLYDQVGPHNYGWYQCRLHVAAGRIHAAGGEAVLRRMWEMPSDPVSDARLADLLATAVHREVARVWTDWPR